ncbi:4'-phosphopantetheinyl transferase superfamily protein [Nocardioides zeae]|uniref:4'-phosphopantetheinyl transferase superfamily protein n=1 Tax=Nocardioides zeae TaxID=1457234 RepID=UPI0035940D46
MGGISIYHVVVRCDGSWAHDLVDDDERRRSERYVRAEDRVRFVVGAALVRLAVGARLGLPPSEVEVDRTCAGCGSDHGRPLLRGTSLTCSLSHSGAHVALALADSGAVGLDLEDAGRRVEYWQDLLGQVVGGVEPRPISRDGFLRIWTRKEALLKLSGEGLRRQMSSLALSFQSSRQGRGEEHGESAPLVGPGALKGAVVRDLDLGDGVHCAVAAYGPPRVVALTTLEA